MPDRLSPEALVVMGVAGCGKSTIGRALASHLGSLFADGDDFHPEENVRKMRAGIPLEDADRLPWLSRLNHWLRKEAAKEGPPPVLACSALKQAYREQLATGLAHLQFIYLKADMVLLSQRMEARKNHFMPRSLLESQLATLEEPGPEALTISAEQGITTLVERIVTELCLNGPPGNDGW